MAAILSLYQDILMLCIRITTYDGGQRSVTVIVTGRVRNGMRIKMINLEHMSSLCVTHTYA